MIPPAFWQTRRWWRQVIGAAGGLWASVGLGVVGTVLAARLLGPGKYAEVVLATAVVTMVNALFSVPIGDAIVHYGYRLRRADRSLRGLIVRALAVESGVALLVTVLLILLAGPAAQAASKERLDPMLVRLAALAVFARTGDDVLGGVLLVMGRADLRAWSMALASAARLAAIAATAIVARTPQAVLVATTVAAGISNLLQGVLVWLVGRRHLQAQVGDAEQGPALGALLRFGVASGLTTTVLGARSGLVPVVLSRLSAPEAAAYLDVALFPVQVADTVSAPVRLALFPEQARLSAEGRGAELRAAIAAYGRGAFLVGVPGAAIGWLALPWMISTLYSAAYAAAVQPARILVGVGLLHLIFGWTKSLPAAIGRPGVRAAILVLDLIAVIVALALLGHAGATGGALALLAGTTVQMLAWLWILPHAVERRYVPAQARPPAESRELG